ncbi:MAG: reverse transcriptase family protein, partial [Pseudomonadota bacterium]
LEGVDWSFLDDISLSLDEKTRNFHENLNSAMVSTIPFSLVRCTSRDKPWITNVIKDLINKRWTAYRNKEFNVYNHLKVKIRNEIKKSKVMWTKKIKSHNLWKAVNVNIGSKSANPILSLISQFDGIENAVKNINEALSSVFLPSSLDSYSISEGGINEWQVHITPHLVFELLKHMPSKKASADIPTILYKRAAAILAEPLSRLFIQSIKECKVPLHWKICAVSPIPKTKSPGVGDLRPISVSPLPAKLLEKLVLNSMKPALLRHFGVQQFGFRPKSSTQCALVSLHEHLTRYLDDIRTDGAIIVTYDYSKAFDRLRADLILDRLAECNFPKEFRVWIKDYLSNRYQFVRIGNACSDRILVTSGVPQGSVLGPYLFAVTTGSLSLNDSCCHLTRYADDTTLCFPIFKSLPNCHIVFEHEYLLRWSTQMDLKINADKCKSLLIPKTSNCESISLSGVREVDSLSILGVVFDSRGSWSSHVSKVIKTTAQRFYPLRILRPSLSNENLKIVYYSIVRSLLEYCAALFVGLSAADSKRLDRVQRRFHRLLCGGGCLEGNCLQPLDERRPQIALSLLRAIMDEEHLLHCNLPARSISGRFILPARRTVRRGKSFFLYTSELFNACFQRSFCDT